MRLVGRGVATALGVLSAWAARVPSLAEACAVCVGPGSEARGLGAGFYWSALLLTLLPFVLTAALAVSIGGATGVWTSAWRRRRGARRSPGPEERAARRVGSGLETALDPVPPEDVLDVSPHRGGVEVSSPPSAIAPSSM